MDYICYIREDNEENNVDNIYYMGGQQDEQHLIYGRTIILSLSDVWEDNNTDNIRYMGGQ